MQNPSLILQIFWESLLRITRGPSAWVLFGLNRSWQNLSNCDFVIRTFKMTHDSLLKALESDSSSNFHAAGFGWMKRSLPQRSCSADPRSWSGDFFLHDWHSLYHWDTSCVISTESDKRFRDSHFPLIIKMNLLKNVGRIHCTSAGSLRVWGPSGDNRHRFQKARWDLSQLNLSVPYMEVNMQ